MEESGKPKIGEFIHLNDIKNNYYTKKEINSMIDKYCPWMRPKIPTPIGGKIFLDTGDNGATYTFYNSSGNIITDTSISGLQSAVKYKVEGTPSSDRFYVVYPSILNEKHGEYWGFRYNADIMSEGGEFEGNIVTTGTRIGTGKTNTKAILDYISIYASSETNSNNKPDSNISQASPNGYNLHKNCGTSYITSLWDIIGDVNNNSLEGHNDWFIPSKDEMYQIVTSKIISNITDEDSIWSSSAYTNSHSAWLWNFTNKDMNLNYRSSGYRCLVCRAF